MVQTTIRLPEKLYEKLKLEAKKRGMRREEGNMNRLKIAGIITSIVAAAVQFIESEL